MQTSDVQHVLKLNDGKHTIVLQSAEYWSRLEYWMVLRLKTEWWKLKTENRMVKNAKSKYAVVRKRHDEILV